jgi:hypothetical protein
MSQVRRSESRAGRKTTSAGVAPALRRSVCSVEFSCQCPVRETDPSAACKLADRDGKRDHLGRRFTFAANLKSGNSGDLCPPEKTNVRLERLSAATMGSCELQRTPDGEVYSDLSFIAFRLAFTSFFTNVIGAGLPIGKLTMAFVVA